MSVRQRLRSTFESRKSSRICWRCALTHSRHSSILRLLEAKDAIADDHKVSLIRPQQPQDNADVQKSEPVTLCIRRSYLPQPKYSRTQHFRELGGKAEKEKSTQCVRVGSAYLRRTSSASFKQAYLRSIPQSQLFRLDERPKVNHVTIQNKRFVTTNSHNTPPNTHHDPSFSGLDARLKEFLENGHIREHLLLWQQQQDHHAKFPDNVALTPTNPANAGRNLLTQSGEDETHNVITRDDGADDMEDDEDVEFGSDEIAPDALENGVFLRKGDLVEILAGVEPILAIFVRNLADQCQFYTMRGEWFHREAGRVRFSVPGFVQPEELNDILPYLPAAQITEEMIDRLQPLDVSAPRDAGAKLLEKMSLFHEAADSYFRKNADRLNRVYEIIAPSKADVGKATMNLRAIALIVSQNKKPEDISPAMMWAVHKAVVQSQNIVRDLVNYRPTVLYEIHPQRKLVELIQVRDWMRDYQEGIIEDTTESFDMNAPNRDALRLSNPIATFIGKARIAIEQSRLTRPLAPNGCLGPSSVQVRPAELSMKTFRGISMQEFSQDEKTIIHYFDAWATSRYLNPLTNFAALGPMILRAVGMYEGLELNDSVGFTFLQELGVISPWENRSVYGLTNFQLPGHDNGIEKITQLHNEVYKEFESSDTFVLPKDSMEGLRHDWADLPVFCIDSAETQERDDGVSVEPVVGSATEYWVHVHVANPSAFIRPGSATGKYAAHLLETVYFPERRYPMLHPSLGSDHLSLARGRPCLTFSARITSDGDILEKRIVPGIVHNVHYLTPHTVGRELGINEAGQSETVSLLTVGGDFPAKENHAVEHTDEALAPSHVDALRKLHDSSKALRRRRMKNSAPEFDTSGRIANTYPKVFLGAQVDPFRVRDEGTMIYEGDPIISIEKTTTGYGLVANMVADLMILAGEIGASWCTERNIPIPYRGLMRNPEPASSPEAFRREIIDPSIARHGHANQQDIVQYMRLLGQAGTSSSPLEHYALGLPAYCKATSPLRRYIDMYTHWQIEAAIRHEAKTGTSLIGSTDDSYLPFSRPTVERYASTALQRERKVSIAKSSSTRHWITQALFRAFYFKEAPLPETFEVEARARAGRRQHGWLNGWNTKVIMADSEATVREGGVKVKDLWEAKIKSVNTYFKLIEMEPIRLIEREARLT